MRRVWTLIAGALLLIGAAPAEPVRYPARTILLFVASWCAPCHGELRQLPAIAGGAGPYRVLVVPIDRGRATDAMLRAVPVEQVWRPDAARMAEVRGELLAKTAGLPFSVCTNCGLPPSARYRAPIRRAWKSVPLEQLEISRYRA